MSTTAPSLLPPIHTHTHTHTIHTLYTHTVLPRTVHRPFRAHTTTKSELPDALDTLRPHNDQPPHTRRMCIRLPCTVGRPRGRTHHREVRDDPSVFFFKCFAWRPCNGRSIRRCCWSGTVLLAHLYGVSLCERAAPRATANGDSEVHARSECVHSIRATALYTALLLVGYQFWSGMGVPVNVPPRVPHPPTECPPRLPAAPTQNLDTSSESALRRSLWWYPQSRTVRQNGLRPPLESETQYSIVILCFPKRRRPRTRVAAALRCRGFRYALGVRKRPNGHRQTCIKSSKRFRPPLTPSRAIPRRACQRVERKQHLR